MARVRRVRQEDVALILVFALAWLGGVTAFLQPKVGFLRRIICCFFPIFCPT